MASFEDLMATAERTLDRLPLEAIAIQVGGHEFSIQAVRDQDRLLAAAGNLAVFPFGLLLWESAVVMADVISQTSPLPGLVLELGAGTGLGSLAAAARGACVVQTDHCAEALALCRRNALSNGVTGIEQRFGDWTNWHDESRFDLVIGADILYEATLYGDILQVLSRTVSPGGEIVLTDPARADASHFTEALKSDGWLVEVQSRPVPALPPCQMNDMVRVDVIRARRC